MRPAPTLGRRWVILAIAAAGSPLAAPAGDASPGPPLFESQVVPILAAKCFACHSTGKRKHGLDVRQRRLLVRGGDSGPAIVPGNAKASLLFKKVAAGEMPPGERVKLSVDEIETVGRWIDAGAKTAADENPLPAAGDDFVTPEDRKHWAFRPVERPAVPVLPGPGGERARTAVDSFILSKLRARGLEFSPDAEKAVLARRAHFDLLGLPPSPAETDAFLADDAPGAFERLVDRLLASPRYGERWGRHWLDAAGYADSDGYTDADTERPHAWKYRDYVIRSFNEDKPFDAFLVEQIAGDELVGYPAAADLTPERIELLTATGFLRNAADGTGQGNVDQQRARNQVVADTLAILGSGVLGLTLACAQCHDHRYDPISQKDYHRIRAAFEPAYDAEGWKVPAARRLSLYTDLDRKRAAEVEAKASAKRMERNAKEAEFVRAVVDKLLAEKIPEAERPLARAAYDAPADKRTPEQTACIEKHPFLKISGGTLYQYDQAAADKVKAMDAEVGQIAATRPPEDFVSALWEEPGRVPPSRLLVRGQPDQPAEEVLPGVLEVLLQAGESCELRGAGDGAASASLKTSGRRLRLALWLARPDHPLTARVISNRIWMHHLGRGIVPTPGDFGKQGDAPTHPELLDWLAHELVRGGWRLKRIHKLIMTSTVYRQSALKAKAGEDTDPENELLWRKPLLRLEGEALRDAMLAVSGAVCLKAGGPPVPVKEDADGSIVVGVDRKAESNRPGADVPIGEEAWRRTVYVQARRTQPLSFTGAFDAPSMETNCTRRPVSIVAPQALTLLNGFFARDQAELFAKRLEKEAGDDGEARIQRAFRLAFARLPTGVERDEAMAFLTIAAPPAGVGSPAGVGIPATAAAQAPATQTDAVHAALVHFCHVIFNASEFIFID